jgi:23S rRNA (pseudouridine1915-N3)-methyltransferase
MKSHNMLHLLSLAMALASWGLIIIAPQQVLAFNQCSSPFIGRACQHHHDGGRKHQKANCLFMISSVKIRIVGKKSGGGGSDGWLLDAYGMYETRLRGTLDVETVWHKNDADLVSAVEGDHAKGHCVVLLDPLAKMYSSETFSDQFYRWMDMGGSRVSFVIGGAEGLPPSLKTMVFQQQGNNKGASAKVGALSLSTMTMTHQFTRVFLLEQVYRASEIQKGNFSERIRQANVIAACVVHRSCSQYISLSLSIVLLWIRFRISQVKMKKPKCNKSTSVNYCCVLLGRETTIAQGRRILPFYSSTVHWTQYYIRRPNTLYRA